MSTANGFDPLWVVCINQLLDDRELDIRIMDVAPEMWDRFIGPMCDAIEDGEFDEVVVAEGDKRVPTDLFDLALKVVDAYDRSKEAGSAGAAISIIRGAVEPLRAALLPFGT